MKTITITDPTQIEEIIRKCPYCIVGITDLEGNPYTVPMNFAYQDGVIYLHSGPEGSKVEMVTKHPQVCITFCEGHELVYMHRQVACSYSMKSRSVICRGKVHFVEDMEEKRRVLDMLMKQYTENECKYAEPAVRNVYKYHLPVTCSTLMERIPAEIFTFTTDIPQMHTTASKDTVLPYRAAALQSSFLHSRATVPSG